MKAIMISIRPKYVADILNGKKTLEIRKTMPKCDLPIEVYIYCTKDKETLSYDVIPHDKNIVKGYSGFNDKDFDFNFMPLTKTDINNGYGWFAREHNLNGKVVGYFTLNKVEEHKHRPVPFPYNELCKNACLTQEEIEDYAFAEGKGYQTLYAWHIDNLVIFDKPKELSEFKQMRADSCGIYYKSLTRASQSYMFIEI